MTKQQLMWITGFYEGEGSAGFYTSARVPRLAVSIAQKDIIPLHYIKKLLGFGNIFTKHISKVGYWQCSSHQARLFLNMIKPYIISPYKLQQINKALIKDKHYVNSIYGSQLALSKLTLKQVHNIRYANKSVNWLTSRYKVSCSIIKRIKTSKTWKGI